MLIAAERRKLDLDRLIADDDEPAIAAITAAELGVGGELATRRRKLDRQAFAEDLLEVLPVIAYDVDVARAHTTLLAAVRRTGRPGGAHGLITGVATWVTGGMGQWRAARLLTLACLVLLNGAPGVGKTSLARRLVADLPLALLVDNDSLRTQLGQWERRAESRGIARTLALALSEAHLSAGHDVVIPQYVGRLEFVEQLASLAHRCGAEFLEVVLVTEANVATERFRARRAEHESSGAAHPEVDVPDADIDKVVLQAIEQLDDICSHRLSTRRVPANSNLEETCAALLKLIMAETR